ncbi:MAG TPA: hypothetical protein VMW62_03925 [Chloroflexota bacterium]|nr:hypothetical protein [Chloroflexota bacterium]
MSKRTRKRRHSPPELLRTAGHAIEKAASWIRGRLCRRIRVEVVIVDKPRRQALQRQLAAGLRQLRHILPDQPDIAVLVQQVIPLERQRAGCCEVATQPDGRRLALIRLALEVNGRRLSADEVLAALAEQCLGLARQQAQATAVVPVDLDPGDPPSGGAAARPPDLPPDPLAPYLRPYTAPPTDQAA